MKEKPIEETLNFNESIREGILYLKYLGAKEIKLGDDKYYLLDNMLFEPNNDYHVLIAHGIDRNIVTELLKSPFSSYYEDRSVFSILNAEGLALLHSVINHDKIDLEAYYNHVFDQLRWKSLNGAYYDFRSVYITPSNAKIKASVDNNVKNRFMSYKKLFDNLTSPGFIFHDINIFNKYLESGSLFHTTGVREDEKGILNKGKFIYTCGTSTGLIDLYPGIFIHTLVKRDINNKEKFKRITHHYSDEAGESLFYVSEMSNGWLQLNITNNILVDKTGDEGITREATPEDYEFFADLLEKMCLATANSLGLENVICNIENTKHNTWRY